MSPHERPRPTGTLPEQAGAGCAATLDRSLGLRCSRYLCRIANDRGAVYVWSATRRSEELGLVLRPGAQAVLDHLTAWTTFEELRARLIPRMTEFQLESTLCRLLAAELIVTSATPRADEFPERFVVVGASISNSQAMVETDAVLRGAPAIATVQPLDSPSPFVQLWRHKMVFVGEPFSYGWEDPWRVYYAVAERYLEVAAQQPGTVYHTSGHPWVGESIPTAIQDLAWRKHAEPVRVLPAISSLDTIFSSLRYDPFCASPLVIVRPGEVEQLVDPRWNMLVVLIGYGGKQGALSRLRPDHREMVREDLSRIRQAALRRLDPCHPVYLVAGLYDKLVPGRGESTSDRKSDQLPYTLAGKARLLAELPDLADEWREGASSLFIPKA